MDNKIPYFTERLSDETLLHILKFVDSQEDFVNLSGTCRKFNNLLLDKNLCEKIKFEWSIRLSRNSFTRFLKERNRAFLITRLDLSDLYWIPSSIIRDLAIGMPSLQVLLAGGTSFGWTHLAQILRALQSLEKVSWSWDNLLEESVRKRSSISPTKYTELIEMKAQFLQLKCLMVHVPMAAKVATDLLFYSFSALAFIISLCKNLEELYLFSWPKSSLERKCSSDLSREDLEENDVDLPKLHTLVISVKEPPRISTPRLVSQLIQSLRRNSTQTKILWLDHPLLGVAQRSNPAVNRNTMRGMRDRSWPQEVNLVNAQRVSYPLMYHISGGEFQLNYPNLKHLLVSHGAPVVVVLNGVFENSSDLESLCCSAFNLRVDWKRFAQMHKKLKEVSIKESEGLEDYCVPLSTLTELRKISLPLECLLEVKDPQALSDYLISQDMEDKSKDCNKTETVSKKASVSQEKHLFKKKRIGVPSKPSVSSSSESRVAGLHLLTAGCSKVNEFEVGFGKSNRSKAGRILVDSLFSISRWKNLCKLSLSLLPIMNGKFLIEICSACDLESIRLSHLGPSGRCCYTADLNQALSFCKNLKDFRFEQTYVGSTTSLLESLQNCQKLKRLLIWSCPNDKSLESENVETLFEKCRDLMMFYATIDSTTKVGCLRTKKSLEAKYRKERPALSIVIRNTLEEDGLINYPSIHYRQMVVNSPQVCQFNDFPTFES